MERVEISRADELAIVSIALTIWSTAPFMNSGWICATETRFSIMFVASISSPRDNASTRNQINDYSIQIQNVLELRLPPTTVIIGPNAGRKALRASSFSRATIQAPVALAQATWIRTSGDEMKVPKNGPTLSTLLSISSGQ